MTKKKYSPTSNAGDYQYQVRLIDEIYLQLAKLADICVNNSSSITIHVNGGRFEYVPEKPFLSNGFENAVLVANDIDNSNQPNRAVTRGLPPIYEKKVRKIELPHNLDHWFGDVTEALNGLLKNK